MDKPSEYEDLIASIALEFTNNPKEFKDWTKRFGRKNLVMGISSFKHQIDVSLECDKDIILIECKKWKNPINVSEYLVLLGRVNDIAKANPDKRVRGALVTTSGWRSGVRTLNSTYNSYCSLFKVSTVGEILERIHKAFIKGHTTIKFKATGNLSKKENNI